MRKHIVIVCILTISAFNYSFKDFVSYWTVKYNGKVIYNSNNDNKSKQLHLYSLAKNQIRTKDTLEIEYFTDTPCYDCIYTYFISEHTDINGEAYKPLRNYLKEQKFLGPNSYKIALNDILNCGTEGTIKSIYYYSYNFQKARELCRINFK